MMDGKEIERIEREAVEREKREHEAVVIWALLHEIAELIQAAGRARPPVDSVRDKLFSVFQRWKP